MTAGVLERNKSPTKRTKRTKPGASATFTPYNTIRRPCRSVNNLALDNISDLGDSTLSIHETESPPPRILTKTKIRNQDNSSLSKMVRERDSGSQDSQGSQNNSQSPRKALVPTKRQPVGPQARIAAAKAKPIDATPNIDKAKTLGIFFEDDDTSIRPSRSNSAISPNMSKPIASTTTASQPKFGQTTPLRSSLDKSQKSIFNVPKPGQRRPEHHRQTGSVQPNQHRTAGLFDGRNAPNSSQTRQPSGVSSDRPDSSTDRALEQMRALNNQRSSLGQMQQKNLPEVFEVRPPTFAKPENIYAPPRPTFSTTQYQPVNLSKPFQVPRTVVDLTHKDDDDEIDPDEGIHDIPFGAPDLHDYVDPTQAQDNIKKLLEGAFDDEVTEKPRLRRRAAKKSVEDSKKMETLAEKLSKLEVDTKVSKEEPEEEDDEDDGTVEGLAVKLLPHQVEGVAWMLEKENGTEKKKAKTLGGILADDMGLGKTIQSIALMLMNPRSEHSDDPKIPKKDRVSASVTKCTLVVAPLALIKQWESEIKEKVENGYGMRVLVHHGPSRTKRGKDLEKYDVVVTTYQTLTSEHAASDDGDGGIKIGCFGVNWYRIFLDEAHSIKNRSAKSTKACYGLRSHYRWCLTGTPMQNNLDELQSLIHFLRIKPYDNYTHWKEQITNPMKNNRGNLAMRRIQMFLKACMKRRTKEVLKKDGALYPGGKPKEGDGVRTFQIVERKVETVIAEFDDNEREFYDKLAARAQNSLDAIMKSEKADYIGALVLLLRLRQACNHPELISNAGMGIDPLPKTKGSKVSSAVDTDLDDIADMFGNMSVEAKKCEICQTKLTASNRVEGQTSSRCADCHEDMKIQRKAANKNERSQRTRRRQRVIDSDDEDEEDDNSQDANDDDDDSNDEGEGSWIVPEDQRKKIASGKAGDTDDENAEGGGEDLGSDDSETDSESDEADRARRLSSRKKKQTRRRNLHDSEAESIDGDASQLEDPSTISIQSTAATPHIGSSTKIRRLISLLKKETPDHKVIVFSQFTTMLDLIEPFLRSKSIKYARYDGSMRNDLREASLNKLRNDPSCRVLLCSLKCGALGLNLTAASRVIIMEPFWNPFVEEQAIDRVHRLNQTRAVHVYRLTIANTVEERILDLQEAKRKLATTALEGGKGNMNVSMADIMKLFSRGAEHEHPVDGPEHDERHVAVATGGRIGMLDPMQRGKGKAVEKEKRGEHPLYGRR